MARVLPAVAVAIALLALAAFGGCGSDSDSTTAGQAGVSTGAGGGGSEDTTGTTEGSKSTGGGQQGGSDGEEEDSGEGGGSTESGGSDITTTPSGEPVYKPDRSLQTFGDEVGGAQKAEVAHAVLSFFRALAKPNYTKICESITKSNLDSFREFLEATHKPPQGCAAVLPTLLPPPTAATRHAAKSTITHVRINGRESIVFFRPAGGAVSYIPMRREGGRWKSLTLVPGSPVEPQIGGP